jgi:hypothetical protein
MSLPFAYLQQSPTACRDGSSLDLGSLGYAWQRSKLTVMIVFTQAPYQKLMG